MKNTFVILASIALFLAACTATKTTVKTTDKGVSVMPAPAPVEAEEPKMEEPKIDPSSITMDANPPADTLPVYRASPKLETDIIHTKLDVKFDWEKQRLMGKAWITAKPYFYATNKIELDAKGFDINKVTMDGSSSALKYIYKDDKLVIDLGKTYNRTDKYTVYIEYVAKPNEAPAGGSAAITSDKGLFFINPDGKEDKPKQIWTQGETESNSRWFPTFDKPIEKMTSEIYMTVEDKYKTLSNGLMKDSKKNADGTRTDHWLMDMPHSPYLVMMAVGEFAVETEKWNGKDIMYYVEPKYAGKGKVIFKYVPEILDFFSKRLGVTYPWQKLAHIVVRDYVSGAMENTTAIVYGDFMNGTERELIDKDYNSVVVPHEMFHHWFGDLVTAESWSNLTVNESFADYSESLWLDHKFGNDAGDHHRREVADGYFGQAEQSIHPLVNFQYNSREDMFDAHSYNKGGCILHMLRTYLGDDAFFEGIGKYLKDNQFKSGESHQLRLALEEVSGEDLNWFWNQWYFKAGHPVLDIKYDYDDAKKQVNVTVEQKQETKDNTPYVFDLPINVDIYQAAGQVKREKIRMVKRTQTFAFDAPSKPALVDFDGDRVVLCQKTDNHNDEEWAFMYANCPKYLARIEALDALKASSNPKAQPTIKAALNDKFWAVREEAVQNIKFKEDPSVLERVSQIAVGDVRSTTRAAALSKLAATKDAKWGATYKSVLDKEQAYPVISSAMQALYKVDAEGATSAAKRYENDENSDLVGGVGSIYAENPKAEHVAFFERNLMKVDGLPSVAFLGSYVKVLEKLGETSVVDKMGKLKDIAVNQAQSPYRRFACTKAINDIRQKYKTQANGTYADLSKYLTEIVMKETNDQLKQIYGQMLGM